MDDYQEELTLEFNDHDVVQFLNDDYGCPDCGDGWCDGYCYEDEVYDEDLWPDDDYAI